MDDVCGGERVDQLRHHPALQPFVDGESMETARDTQTTQEGHEQCAFGVALSITVREHFGRWERIIRIVAEQNFVTNKVIGCADPVS